MERGNHTFEIPIILINTELVPELDIDKVEAKKMIDIGIDIHTELESLRPLMTRKLLNLFVLLMIPKSSKNL